MIVELLCSTCGKKVRIVQEGPVDRPFAIGYRAGLICPAGHVTSFELLEIAHSDGVSIRVKPLGKSDV